MNSLFASLHVGYRKVKLADCLYIKIFKVEYFEITINAMMKIMRKSISSILDLSIIVSTPAEKVSELVEMNIGKCRLADSWETDTAPKSFLEKKTFIKIIFK